MTMFFFWGGGLLLFFFVASGKFADGGVPFKVQSIRFRFWLARIEGSLGDVEKSL